MLKTILSRLRDRSGQGLPEYALLFAAVAVMAIVVSVIFTAGVGALFQGVLDHFSGSPPAT